MKGARKRMETLRSLYSLEKTMARFLPAGLLEELLAMPGRRVRWLPMTLIFLGFLQMLLGPARPAGKPSGRLRRGGGGRGGGGSIRTPMPFARRERACHWPGPVAESMVAAGRPDLCGGSLPGCHRRWMLVVDGTTAQTPETAGNQAQKACLAAGTQPGTRHPRRKLWCRPVSQRGGRTGSWAETDWWRRWCGCRG